MKNLRGKMIFKKLLLHQFPKIYDFGRATTLLETLALCVTVRTSRYLIHLKKLLKFCCRESQLSFLSFQHNHVDFEQGLFEKISF